MELLSQINPSQAFLYKNAFSKRFELILLQYGKTDNNSLKKEESHVKKTSFLIKTRPGKFGRKICSGENR